MPSLIHLIASYLVDAKRNPSEIKGEKREYFRHLVTMVTPSYIVLNLILLKSVRAFTSEPLCWIQWDQWVGLLGILFQLRLGNPKEKKNNYVRLTMDANKVPLRNAMYICFLLWKLLPYLCSSIRIWIAYAINETNIVNKGSPTGLDLSVNETITK